LLFEQVLLVEVEAAYEEDFMSGVHSHFTNLKTLNQSLNCDYIDERTDEQNRKYKELVEKLTNRLTEIQTLIKKLVL